MIALVIDCETTGLPPKGMSPRDPDYPRIVELAWRLIDTEAPSSPLGLGASLFRTEDRNSSAGALNIHGISDRARGIVGMEPKRALTLFMAHLAAADVVVAHGVSFDLRMVLSELHRLGDRGDRLWRQGLQRCCTMTDAGAFYNSGRFMKLVDAHREVTGEEYHQAHRAMPDCEAAERIFLKLLERGHASISRPTEDVP